MSYAHLILKQGVWLGVWDLSGQTVTLGKISPDDDFHEVTVDGTGLRVKFSNDEDVYE